MLFAVELNGNTKNVPISKGDTQFFKEKFRAEGKNASNFYPLQRESRDFRTEIRKLSTFLT